MKAELTNELNPELIWIKSWGGLGDCLLMTPAIKSLKLSRKNRELHMFCISKLHREILDKNPYIDNFVEIDFYEENKEKFIEGAYGNIFPIIRENRVASEIICDMLRTPPIGDNLEIYLSEEEIEEGILIIKEFESPICISPSSSSQNQEWEIEKWETLVKRNPKYTFIHIGTIQEPRINGTIDMRSRYFLRTYISMIKASLAYIGMDSFFNHVSSAVNTPGVILFGDSTPKIWGHYNNINIYKGLRCSPCIDTLTAARCPYGKKCMTDITVEEVELALQTALAWKKEREIQT
jgi:ADP-heptose:LPS heptosyltransferase